MTKNVGLLQAFFCLNLSLNSAKTFFVDASSSGGAYFCTFKPVFLGIIKFLVHICML